MLEQAFEALKTYDWGADRGTLNAIDQEIVASHGDDTARRKLEDRLAAVLQQDVSRDAKDFVCRKLRLIGSAASASTLGNLLTDPQLSHMARYALESIPVPEAAEALRSALDKVDGPLKAGVIGSLGVRQDANSVPELALLLGDSDAVLATAAAHALGAIRSSAAAKAFGATAADDKGVRRAVTDSSLACAEALLDDGKKVEALVIYKRLAKDDQPKHVRLAATRGILAAAGKT